MGVDVENIIFLKKGGLSKTGAWNIKRVGPTPLYQLKNANQFKSNTLISPCK